MPLYRDLLFGAKSVSTLGVLIAIHAFPSVAVACTFCHSDTARQVRAGIFGPDFGFHVFVTVIPFAIFLAITTLLYFGVPGRNRIVPEGAIQ